MGFKSLADLDADVCYALGGSDRKTGKANPTQVEGYYIGSRQVPSPKSKTGFAALHIFQTPEGNVGIWGKTNLDSKLGRVTPGTMARVTFLGMKETKNNPMYVYGVEVDSDNTIPVGEPPTSSGADGSDDEPLSDDEDLSPMDEVPQAPPPRAAAPQIARTPSPEAQAKVQALMNKARARSA